MDTGWDYTRKTTHITAEEWLSLSLNLLQFYTNRTDYEEEMLQVYNVVLEKTKISSASMN